MLDYTTSSSFTVRVRSTDLGGFSIEQAFTVLPPAYVLWTRSDTGRAVLWLTDPGEGSGSPKVIPVADIASVHSTGGNGSPWQATSYAHVSATEGYVLWTRSDTGRAVLWRIDPSAASGAPKVTSVSTLASVQSTTDMRHTRDTTNAAEFGRHYTRSAPQNIAPPDMFYDVNLTWLGPFNGEPNYAPCVSCHNPHGTDVTSPRSDGNNKMTIYTWTAPSTLCGKCHR